tara:strand:+ start:2097 stop:2351 length:255 start_codon:yes stop_codon:yes gene_type:complete
MDLLYAAYELVEYTPRLTQNQKIQGFADDDAFSIHLSAHLQITHKHLAYQRPYPQLAHPFDRQEDASNLYIIAAQQQMSLAETR